MKKQKIRSKNTRALEDNVLKKAIVMFLGRSLPDDKSLTLLIAGLSSSERNHFIQRFLKHKAKSLDQTENTETQELINLRKRISQQGFHEGAKVPGSHIRKIDK